MQGKVYIVGAGPGAADLLTVRAASILRHADVVLHDDLVSGEVLDLAPPSARIINVGKRCGRHSHNQQQINELMVGHAQVGSTVVRLKSGDPAVFGRLSEELTALREAGVAFDIVAGVTAASAAAAAANITLTDRRSASSLVVLTGHLCQKNHDEKLFDPARTTYAIYMPGPDYSSTMNQLRDLGVDDQTPCAVISRAGRSDEQVRHLRLSELKSLSGIEAPALLLVGEVTRSVNGEHSRSTSETLSAVAV